MIQNFTIFNSIQDALNSIFGDDTTIVQRSHISGGDINDSFLLKLSNGKNIFMKQNSNPDAHFFIAEANGLLALDSLKIISTPQILALGTNIEGTRKKSFLLLEYITPSTPQKNFWQTLGNQLAEHHKKSADNFTNGKKFGFFEDNFIGHSVQKNTPSDSWIDFFRQNRLLVQVKKAESYFDNSFLKRIDFLLEHLDDYLIECDYGSIVHGDLWRGNVFCDSKGMPMLIDPACYVGFYEVDIAMTELFGRFPKEFYDAYWQTNPKIEGYEVRREIYNLYHLLNHLNMFGGSYLWDVKRIVDAQR